MKIELKNIPISKLLNNEGQIEGVPQNPRFIEDNDFKNLVQSIKELPEMLELRELIVFPLKTNFIVIGGNMRLRAGNELKFTEMPCKILHKDTPVDVLRQIAIKDNGSYGKNSADIIANEWEEFIQDSWGVEMIQDIEEEKAEEAEIFTNADFEIKELNINVSKHWFEQIHRDIRKKIKESDVSDDILELLVYCKMYYNYCKTSKKRFSVVVPLREDYAKIFQKYPEEIVSDFQNYIYEKYNKQSKE